MPFGYLRKMNENITIIKTVKIAPPSAREIARYARAAEDDAQSAELIKKCVSSLCRRDEYPVAYRIIPIFADEDSVRAPFGVIFSSALAKVLKGCTRAVIFALTAGMEYDLFIHKNASFHPAESLIASALGSERAESIADAFCDALSVELAEQGCSLTPRFSPGYADLSLDLQRDIFDILALQKNIGLYLNESLLMSPSKSVTAIMGVKENDVS